MAWSTDKEVWGVLQWYNLWAFMGFFLVWFGVFLEWFGVIYDRV